VRDRQRQGSGRDQYAKSGPVGGRQYGHLSLVLCLLDEKRKNAAAALQKRFNSRKSCYGGNKPEERSQRASADALR